MTQLTVYAAEYFRRSKWRYVCFSLFFLGLIVLSILYNNIVGAILLFFLLGGYLFFSVSNMQLITLGIKDQGLVIGSALRSWSTLSGYALEIDDQSKTISTIVFVTPTNQKMIHTVVDSSDMIERFVVELDQYLPLQQQLSRTFVERMTRVLQL